MIKLSVHELIDRVLIEGSIDNRFQFSEHTAQEGTRLHQKLQKQFAKNEEYHAEQAIKSKFEIEEFEIQIEGRIDGVILGDVVSIDEIKTSEYSFEELPASQLNHYWYQLKIYGYLYLLLNKKTQLNLRLSYFETINQKLTQKSELYTLEQLGIFFNQTMAELVDWLKYEKNHRENRNQSIEAMAFPFDSYRKGQRELMKAVYGTILEQKRLYTLAPTGTGKTLSTIFPTLKAMPVENLQRLFYLTAKIATRKVAEETVALMSNQGLRATSVTLSSKDSICFLDERTCNPEVCPFAKNYYDKLRTHRREILEQAEQFTRPVIEQLAKSYQMCPFELGLDLASYADIIILDYNYLFDPRAYLRRFFEQPDSSNFLLIDEAHNLVDRARNMYTASLSLKKVKAMTRLIKQRKIKNQLKKLINELENLDDFMVENHLTFHAQSADSSTIQKQLLVLTESFKKVIAEAPVENQQTLLDFYFELMAYLKINDFYDSSFKTFIKKNDWDLELTITCINPAEIISQRLSLARGAALFSASFTPLSYYQKMLGGKQEDYYLTMASPFDEKKHLLLVNPAISVTYRNRQQNIPKIVSQIQTMIGANQGNYLVFFPSFAFLTQFLEWFETTANLVIQTPTMSAEEKQLFLSNFNQENEQTTVGLAVLGGSFAEGIDLKGKKLIGVAIITVGLPMITEETNEIQAYYQNNGLNGFQYAYQIPAMNKVLQAVGRLIRTEMDFGVTLLIDERFGTKQYQRFFPAHWQHFQLETNDNQLRELLEHFWLNQNIR
ncbi:MULTISPECIES: ATP-dependent DNA helicase [unclassified Enterococcus]|uniref:ATP-dependent DNA helicase n=1 Tax=unclassified Enterococcus TaxID=2608891 RepID=UPI0015583398|nr:MULTISPECIES: ATP-dependent DNA helicase [unclassified Enterococcus]MBS7577918.1 ATP-dependent DNA helicase [Enterococcus sp. MMGLQ5-2]MBS7585221.1 ATP-dependent DNA helicase [Enterococcus sp. MMGLQ5-1]NPD13078.1 ATP-dependent DNA helicase [Enterococcus sp. MMGLQ5-1]NPD37748.1 ATP-dependent DNA helicase [Enterococcus sp. MMGLQ5-2]